MFGIPLLSSDCGPWGLRRRSPSRHRRLLSTSRCAPASGVCGRVGSTRSTLKRCAASSPSSPKDPVLVVLDWQHTCYRLDAVTLDAEWRVPVYPKGTITSSCVATSVRERSGTRGNNRCAFSGTGSWARSRTHLRRGCRSSESTGNPRDSA